MNAIARQLHANRPKVVADWVSVRLAELMLLKEQGRIHVVGQTQYLEVEPGKLQPVKVVLG